MSLSTATQNTNMRFCSIIYIETKIRNDSKNGDRHMSLLGVYLYPSAIGLINK